MAVTLPQAPAKELLRTYYLEMTRPEQLRPAATRSDGLSIIKAELPCPELNRFLYTAVGHAWQWVDRLSRSRDQWLAYVNRPELETWVAYLRGTPAGYFELERQPGNQIEIRIFGVFPFAQGQGLGGRLLTFAIERSWSLAPRRVWVHTCTRDHSAALQNYLARGLKLYSIVEAWVEPVLPRAWPG